MMSYTFKASFVLLLSAVNFLPSNATELSAELYWKTKLGNISMPKVLKYSLQLDAQGGKVNSLDAHPVDLDAPDARGNIQWTHPADLDARGNIQWTHPAELDARGNIQWTHPADLDARGNIQWTHPAKLDARGNIQWTHPADLDARGNIQWTHSADYTVPQYDRVIYFTYEQLFIAGTKMKLHFRKINDGVKFLPLHVAKSIAIASNKLQMILNTLSVNKKSTTAQYIENTIKDCEERGVKDEVRFCATSLQSMVDNILNLNSGKNKLMVVSTEQENDILMEYKIEKAKKLGKDDNQTMICHKLENPYAVFLCHNIKSTDVYDVTLVGANENQMTAIAVCHKDTSGWNPKHLAFQLLRLKPGSKPICHFLSGDAIVWFQN